MPDPVSMHVHLVLHAENQGWVIEKIARRLIEHLPAFGITATFSERPRSDVALNHWMSYAFANEPQSTPASMFITHIDDPYKVSLVRRELAEGINVGICMSSHQVDFLAAHGVPRHSLCHVLPAHDNRLTPRRIRIGIATRLYPDGRKRESLLLELARQMRLDAFEFEIHGAGWDAIVPALRAAGAEVNYFAGTVDFESDYQQLILRMPQFDFYLYLGMDEGSLGTLDAVAAAVPTIVTAQGFHLDLGAGLDHTFTEFEQLREIFQALAARRDARLHVAAELGWSRYAERHALIWRAVVAGADIERALAQIAPPALSAARAPPPALNSLRFRARALHPRRIASALAHWGPLKPLRKFLFTLRSRRQG